MSIIFDKELTMSLATLDAEEESRDEEDEDEEDEDMDEGASSSQSPLTIDDLLQPHNQDITT